MKSPYKERAQAMMRNRLGEVSEGDEAQESEQEADLQSPESGSWTC